MLEIGDLVKAIGKTVDGDCKLKELIPIGTICEVINVDEKDETAEILPLDEVGLYNGGFWYDAKDLQKGRLEWIPESEVN